VVSHLFDSWALCNGTTSGQLMPASHFIPEKQPKATALALSKFVL
jgi:hypothetical protein